MDLARANALGWLRAVPAADRVLLVRADALATPATAWELDRRNVARAILESQPGATALNLSQSLQFARQLQRGSGSLAGRNRLCRPGPHLGARSEQHVAAEDPRVPRARRRRQHREQRPAQRRRAPLRHRHRHMGRSGARAKLRQDGRKLVNVTLNFGNVPQGSRPLELPPGERTEVTFTVHTRAAGILEARLYPKDAFAADNYAALELPRTAQPARDRLFRSAGRAASRAGVRSARRRRDSARPRSTRPETEADSTRHPASFPPASAPAGQCALDRSAGRQTARRRSSSASTSRRA